jgi:DNA-binding MarR family transcriptional regulator
MQATPAAAIETEALTRDLYALAYHLLRNANVTTFNAIAELDLSFTQIKALCALDSAGEARSVGALAESLAASLPAISRAVDGLYERGFVSREEDPADRRMKRVRLTPAGAEIPAALSAGRLSALQELIESLSAEEADRLAAALTPIVERRPEIAECRPEQRGPA